MRFRRPPSCPFDYQGRSRKSGNRTQQPVLPRHGDHLDRSLRRRCNCPSRICTSDLCFMGAALWLAELRDNGQVGGIRTLFPRFTAWCPCQLGHAPVGTPLGAVPEAESSPHTLASETSGLPFVHPGVTKRDRRESNPRRTIDDGPVRRRGQDSNLGWSVRTAG